MEHKFWTRGETVSLSEILDAREKRVQIQRELLSVYPQTLISFTLNIPGPVKVFPLTVLAYEAGLGLISSSVPALGGKILKTINNRKNTGYEAFFCVNLPPEKIKEQLCFLEERHPLGRIFDFDVLDYRGEKFSRQALGYKERTCLLCGRPAFLCGRSRTHTVRELLEKEIQLMEDFFSERMANHIGLLMQKALFYEVNTSLKPGLVDRLHNGSHKDMERGDFMKSAYALTPYFIQCARAGLDFSPSSQSPKQLFSTLRTLGKQAELTMLQATKGVNTHKGMIFSGGIFSCLAGWYFSQKGFEDNFSSPGFLSFLELHAQKLLTGLLEDYKELAFRPAKTHGERLYQKYGVAGIRGEASAGFPHVLKKGLPIFEDAEKKGYSLNQCGLLSLLYYISSVEDSNLMIRGGFLRAKKIQEQLCAFLERTSFKEWLEVLKPLDSYFVSQNISPGGSADMLALTYFLYFLKRRPCPFL